MKFVFVCFLLICTLVSVLGDCNLEGKILKVDEHFAPLGTCLNYKCEDDGSFSILGCPAFPDSPGCRRVAEDVSKPYPECCEHLEC